jgi:hypothetical protein
MRVCTRHTSCQPRLQWSPTNQPTDLPNSQTPPWKAYVLRKSCQTKTNRNDRHRCAAHLQQQPGGAHTAFLKGSTHGSLAANPHTILMLRQGLDTSWVCTPHSSKSYRTQPWTGFLLSRARSAIPSHHPSCTKSCTNHVLAGHVTTCAEEQATQRRRVWRHSTCVMVTHALHRDST